MDTSICYLNYSIWNWFLLFDVQGCTKTGTGDCFNVQFQLQLMSATGEWPLIVTLYQSQKKTRETFFGGLYRARIPLEFILLLGQNLKNNQTTKWVCWSSHTVHDDCRSKYTRKTSGRRDLTERGLMRRKRHCRKLMRDYNLNWVNSALRYESKESSHCQHMCILFFFSHFPHNSRLSGFH